MLLGRQTYDEFAAYWPSADPADPITGAMNGSRKYVVSTTLTDATWENSSVVTGDVAAELAALKQTTSSVRRAARPWSAGCSSRVSSTSCTCWSTRSSSATARSCSPDGETVPLELVSSTTFDTGVLHLVYARAHQPDDPPARPQWPEPLTKEKTMRYMVMHYQTQEMEDGFPPSPENQAAIGRYMQESAMSGVLLSGEGVPPAPPAPGSR